MWGLRSLQLERRLKGPTLNAALSSSNVHANIAQIYSFNSNFQDPGQQNNTPSLNSSQQTSLLVLICGQQDGETWPTDLVSFGKALFPSSIESLGLLLDSYMTDAYDDSRRTGFL